MAYEGLGEVNPELNHQLQAQIEATSEKSRLELTPGQRLLSQGEAQEYAYYIVSGVLVATHLDEAGCEHYKEFYFAGELVFLYSAWINQGAAQYNIEVLKPSQVLRVPIGVLSRPHWQALVLALLKQQVLYKEAKEAFLLLQTPQQRYQYLYQHRRHWLAQLSLHQVAKYLGISAVSLSRIRARLGIS
ncbi:Crp/Fnr family transcriptional regulator [Pseudoalteromonas sp. YIC-827]|uniref:Crp/Fnr family transcriptional regulator n=1 Tax=Pseudoalteromonas qingdaonensis TaxID=3131913 RepID=A0ABU9MZA8_9GAMM